MTGRRRFRLQPADREIFRLAIPAFVALVAEPLYLLADSAIIGHLGTPQLAALGLAGSALVTVVSLCVFLAYGTTASVARRIGAGDLPGALRQGIDGMWLALAIGTVSVAAGVPLADDVVRALGASATVEPYAVTYLRIALLGVPAMLVALAATGILRGLQDVRTPLIVAAAGYAANVVLNVALVYGADMGIAGSAWGTVIAQVGSVAAYIVVVVRAARRHGVELSPRLAGVGAAGVAGLPLLARTVTLRAALLLMTYVAARQGDVALAAHQVAFTLWSLLALALDAIAIAGQAIVGRALGAGDIAGTRRATRRIMGWGAVSGVVLGALLLVLRPFYAPLFSPDPAVQDQLVAVLLVAALLQPVSGVVFALDGVLIGAGDGAYLAVAGVLTLGVFAPIAYAVQVADAGLVWLWCALGAFMLARLATLLLRARSDAWLRTGAARGRLPDPERSPPVPEG